MCFNRESAVKIIFIWCVLQLFMMFIVPAVNKIQVFLRIDCQARPMQCKVFGQFELVISIFSVGLLNTKGDMQALSSFSLNCSDHKLTQFLISLPMAVTLWLVSRIGLPGTLTDSDTSDVLLQYLRSISAVVNHGLVFALASQNTWNAPSEIIPTWDLQNDLHDICRELKFPANCIWDVCFPFVFFSLFASTSANTIISSLPPYTTCISMNSPLLDKFKNNSASKREKPKKIRRGLTKIERKSFTDKTSIKLFYSNINGYRSKIKGSTEPTHGSVCSGVRKITVHECAKIAKY